MMVSNRVSLLRLLICLLCHLTGLVHGYPTDFYRLLNNHVCQDNLSKIFANPGTVSKRSDSHPALSRRVDQNVVPQWIMCMGPQGDKPQMYNAAEIIRALNEGFYLLTASKTVGNNDYPHAYNKDGKDPNAPKHIGRADRTRLMEFPLVPGDYVYGAGPTVQNGDPGPPGPDRVIFDVCAQFASVVSHRVLDDHDLRTCFEVDARGNHINTPGVPGMNLNPHMPRPRGRIQGLPPPPPPRNPSPSEDGIGSTGGTVGFLPTAGPEGIGEGAQGGTIGEMPLNLIPGYPFKKAEAAPAA